MFGLLRILVAFETKFARTTDMQESAHEVELAIRLINNFLTVEVPLIIFNKCLLVLGKRISRLSCTLKVICPAVG